MSVHELSRGSPGPVADDVLDLADRLRPALLRLSRHLRREAQRFGMSVLDVQLLFAVKTSPGVTASELADHEQISRPTMSTHVKRLEDAGWVMRRTPGEEADRRRQGLEITAEGLAALQAVRRQHTDWLAGRLARLSAVERRTIDAALPAMTSLLQVIK